MKTKITSLFFVMLMISAFSIESKERESRNNVSSDRYAEFATKLQQANITAQSGSIQLLDSIVDYKSDDDSPLTKEEYFYNQKGLLSKDISYNAVQIGVRWEKSAMNEYEYDGSDRPIKIIASEWNESQNKWAYSSRIISNYQNETKVQEVEYADWKVDRWVDNSKVIYYYPNPTTIRAEFYMVNEDGVMENSGFYIKTTLDERSNIILIENYNGTMLVSSSKMEYDTNGNLLVYINSALDFYTGQLKELLKTVSTYNSRNQIVSEIDYYKNGNMWVEKTQNLYSYNGYDNISKQEVYNWVDAHFMKNNYIVYYYKEGGSVSSITETRMNISTKSNRIIVKNIDETEVLNVYNINGQLLHSAMPTGNAIEITVAPGIYIVTNARDTKKVIVAY